MTGPEILLIEGSDFETFPVGGQLTMARAMMKLFGSRLVLVGVNRHGEPTGRWLRKKLFGQEFHFFPVTARESSWKRPLIPARYTFYSGLRRHHAKILDAGCTAAFIQTPEALLEASRWNLDNICYWFAGVENPLMRSRYRFARPLWRLFDKRVFAALESASLVLAAADEPAIRSFVLRSNGRIARNRIVRFPTCVDVAANAPVDQAMARRSLGLPTEPSIFVSLGRIGCLKGWDLLLDAFDEFLREHGDGLLIFVGDGEDKPALLSRLGSRPLAAKVLVTGFQPEEQVRLYLSAADTVLSGSRLEGWSVSMLEALACGKPLVSTSVSGTDELIVPGSNGFILHNRDPYEFALCMKRSLELPNARSVSRQIAERYDIDSLGKRLIELWPPLRENGFDAGSPEHFSRN